MLSIDYSKILVLASVILIAGISGPMVQAADRADLIVAPMFEDPRFDFSLEYPKN